MRLEGPAVFPCDTVSWELCAGACSDCTYSGNMEDGMDRAIAVDSCGILISVSKLGQSWAH